MTNTKRFNKNSEGVCPFCGSKEIEYGNMEFEFPYLFYECECKECAAEFTEVYECLYDGFNTYEDGVERLYDTDGNEIGKEA